MQNNSVNFCVNFLWWFTEELPHIKWLKEEYVKYNDRLKKWELAVNFERLYNKYFNISYPHIFEKKPQSFYETGTLIMLAYNVLINREKRAVFVNEVNRRLKIYGADIRLRASGKFREVTAESRAYDEAEEYEPSSDGYIFAAICSFLLAAIALLKLF